MAFVFLGSRKFKIFVIKPHGPYFILNTPQVKGIFEMDSNYVEFYDKTPCYFYNYKNPKPISPTLVGELNYFAIKNLLHKITRKDVRHGSLLRKVGQKNPDTAKEKTVEIVKSEQDKIDATMNKFFSDLETTENEKKKTATKEYPYVPLNQEQVSYTLTNHLLIQELIDVNEKMLLDDDIRSGKMTFEQLIDQLRDKAVVTINSPISMDAERFLEAFHAYDPARVWNWVEKLATLDKRLKTMTSVPVKNWIPASIIMAIAIGGSIGFIVILNNIGQIKDGINSMFPHAAPVIAKTAGKFILGALGLFN